MNYFSGAMNYIAGAPAPADAPVARLVDRIAASTLPRDRRAALADLASAVTASPSAQADAAERAPKVVYAVLEQDREFDDTLRVVLDVLVGVCGVLEWRAVPVAEGEERKGKGALERAQGEWEKESRAAARMGVEVFLGLPGAMGLLLELLDTRDLFIKCSTIELLTAMAVNARETAQGAVLASEEAVAKVADLLDDSNALVRTNATLLLSALAEGSAEICKIAAFSGVLETLFRTLSAATVGGPSGGMAGRNRGGGGGGAVVEEDPESAIAMADCLTLVRSLLRGSTATQTFLRDGGCVPKLAQVLTFCADRSAYFAHRVEGGVSGPALAVARQHNANLLLAVECIRELVTEDSAEAGRNRTACAASGVFRTIVQLCFALPLGGDAGERCVMQVSAIMCAAGLVTCHDEIRGMFASPMNGLGGAGRARSPQVVCVEAMISDDSAAVRSAAYALLTASVVADVRLHLPTTAFLNAIVTESDAGTIGGGYGGGGSGSLRSSVTGAATLIKDTVVGWPNDADGAGVFYSTNLVAWVAGRVRGARERLLGSRVGGGGDVLLSRTVRTLGQAVREEAPAAVRIGLLRLICTWLFESPSAVSAFLSSAMHLPLIVELVTKTASRADSAVAVHVQGLAALLLAICLESIDGEDGDTDGGFVSGGGGASAVIPRSTIVEMVRNRIGVATFTARLDELRATRAFVAALANDLADTQPLPMAEREKKNGFGKRGDVGHDLWYDAEFAALADSVYSKIGARVVDLVGSGDRPSPLSGHGHVNGAVGATGDGATAKVIENGVRRDAMSVMNSVTPSAMAMPLLESSSRDDVLVSYKELIRTQDSSLSDARKQVKELESALREAQLELDAKNRSGADRASRSEREQLKAANATLTEKVSALEDLVEDKTSEFAALSDAYSALESMGAGGEEDEEAFAERERAHHAALDRLRHEKASALAQFYTECDKVTRLEQERSRLQLAEQTSSAQLQAVEAERDALRSGIPSAGDEGDTAEWRRRALGSEGQMAAISSALRRAEDTCEELRARTQSLEASNEEATSRAVAAAAELEQVKADVAQAAAARKRELQMARESTAAADRAAKEESNSLRAEIEKLRAAGVQAADTRDAQHDVEALSRERDAAKARAESLSADLVDTQNSVAEWRQRAERTTESTNEAKLMLNREQAENARLSGLTREIQASSEALRSKLEVTKAESEERKEELSSVTRRVTELEAHCSDLEEMRVRSSDELTRLKEEVAARAEQTIRLSGNVYEAEEARAEAEARALAAEARARELEAGGPGASDGNSPYYDEPNTPREELLRQHRSSEDEEYIAALTDEIVSLKEKISCMQADVRDKRGLSSAVAQDREEALLRLQETEAALAAAMAEKGDREAEIVRLQDRLLLLGEAEQAKRMLSERVGELERALSVMEESTESPRSSSAARFGGESLLSQLRIQLDEKQMRLNELETSLATMAEGGVSAGKNIGELEKQLSESEALLSVVSSEKTELSHRASALQAQIDGLRSEKSHLEARVQSLEGEAADAALSSSVEEREVVAPEAASILAALYEELAAFQKTGTDLEAELSVSRLQKQELEQNLVASRKQESDAVAELAALGAAAAAAESEIDELKAALSDAAKSFNASAKELAQREELLVEISRDKSAITNDLERARAEIDALRDDNLSMASAFAADKAKLTEQLVLAEQKTSALETTLTSCGAPPAPVVQLDDASNADALATAVLLDEIEGKMTLMESKHAFMTRSMQEDKTRIMSLVNDLAASKAEARDAESRFADVTRQLEGAARRQTTYVEAKADAVRRGDEDSLRLRQELAKLKSESMGEIAGLRARLDAVTKDFAARVEAAAKLENDLESAHLSLETLKQDLDKTRAEKLSVLQARDKESKALSTLQATLADAEKHAAEAAVVHASKVAALEADVSETKSSRASAVDELRKTVLELETAVSAADSRSGEIQSKADGEKEAALKRIADLESELDSSNEALEIAERQLRDTKASARVAASMAAADALAAEEGKCALLASISEKDQAIAAADELAVSKQAAFDEKLRAKQAELQEKEGSLTAARSASDTLLSSLVTIKAELTTAEENLAAAAGRVVTLETELSQAGDDVMERNARITTLESTVAERDSSLATALEQVNQAEAAHAGILQTLSEARQQNTDLSVLASNLEEEIGRLRKARGRLEEEADSLRTEIDVVESERAVLEKDNSDLRKWVMDLEQQATGLQALAEKFEDVEQSLDEAVSAHQSSMDTNAGLLVKVDTLSNSLEEAEASARAANAAKDAAEATAKLAENQVKDLDARLQEIRATHAGKISLNEGKIRSNVQRCGELELELAAAERQLAESATLSDRVFAVEKELALSQEKATANLLRAEAAEAAAEEVRREVSRLEKDLEASARSAGGAAYAELEAEHNELLMCLADLEMEYTHLKDTTVAVTTTKQTADSVSAR